MEKGNIFNFVEVTDKLSVMNMVEKIIGSTLGPNGKYIVIGNEKLVHTTKDGVTCLNLLQSKDPFVNNLLKIIKEASLNTLKKAGDGTTSTVVIAKHMLEGLVKGAFTEKELKNKVNKMVELLSDLKINSLKDELLKKVIYTSLSGDVELTDVVYKAYKMSDKGINIITENVSGSEHRVLKINGISVNAKPASDLFVQTKPIFSHPLVVCVAGNVETESEVIGFIENALQHSYKEVIILANGYTEEALGALGVNHMQNIIKVLPLLVSGGNKILNIDVMKIIATSINAPIGGQDYSTYLSDINISDFVPPEHAVFEKGQLVLEKVKGNKNEQEIQYYLSLLENSKNDDEAAMNAYIVSLLKREMVKILIASNIENKGKEIKDRIDDTLHSIRTSQKYGVVEGGGITYKKLNNMTPNPDKFQKVFEIIYNKIKPAPTTNAIDSLIVVQTVLETAMELALLLNNTEHVVFVN